MSPFPRSAPMAMLSFAALAIAGCGGGGAGPASNGAASTAKSQTPVSTAPGPTTPGATTPAPAASAGGASTVKLEADEEGKLYFNKKRATAKAGSVTLVMRNPGSSGIQHGIAIEGQGVDKDGPVVSPGATSRITVNLKPGRYEYYCPFDSHRKLGMKGTLVVS